MSGRHTGSKAAVMNTYSRLIPVRKVQFQPWLSPADRRQFFTSSSSPSLLSSSRDPSSSGDSDYRPPKRCRKKSVACKRVSTKSPAYVAKRKRRGQATQQRSQGKESSLSQTSSKGKGATAETQSSAIQPPAHRGASSGWQQKICITQEGNLQRDDTVSNVTASDRENHVPCDRVQSSSFSFSTPYRKFVTIRRKSPARNLRLRNGRPPSEKVQLICISSDSTSDFETCRRTLSKRRKLHTDVNNILNSSTEITHSPLHKAPLFSSTPSVLQTALPRAGNALLQPMSLFEGLEESLAFVEEEHSRGLEQTIHTSRKEVGEDVSRQDSDTRILTHTMDMENIGHQFTGNVSAMVLRKEPKGRLSLQPTLQKLRAEAPECRTSQYTLSSNSPSVLSPSSSRSVICIEDEPIKKVSLGCHTQKHDSVFCVSSELFSNALWDVETPLQKIERAPVECSNLCDQRQTRCHQTMFINHTTDDEAEKGRYMSVLNGVCTSSVRGPYVDSLMIQPFVRLDPDVVSRYLQQRNRGAITACQQFMSKSNMETERPLFHSDIRLKMTPVVCLDASAVTNYFMERRKVTKGIPGIDTMCGAQEVRGYTPVVRNIAKTPNIHASSLKDSIPFSSAPPPETTNTGRKVCISGFSAKRWGQRPKKSKNCQQLSFKGDCEMSAQKWKNMSTIPAAHRLQQDVSTISGLSSSLLLSTSLLTSSFLNSSAVMNLSLSPEPLRVQDPQRDRQRRIRLRAALSLHRKKKVEAALHCVYPVERSVLLSSPSPCNLNISLTLQQSSLMLLSPHYSSVCSEELSDAEKVFVECQQEGPIPFCSCLTSQQLSLCQKVGEGVYGEVFKTLRDGSCVALKVIPIEGSQKINGEDQKTFAEILPEIIISKELSLLSECKENRTSGFIRLYSAHCVQGTYPPELLQAWDMYTEKRRTENQRPDIFGPDQLFMILEFEFGGNDLESMSDQIPTVAVSRNILHQVAAALAIAEEELRFEHRDLHWGNLLIEKCASKSVAYSLHGKSVDIPTSGYQVKIIDYTLSRLDKDGLTVFCDLTTDEDLFLGEGDLQFDVYRAMRHENKNTWASYLPHTNVLWLHYLTDKLLTSVNYIRKSNSAAQRRELRRLQDFRREVQGFSSALETLQRSKLFK